MQHEQLIYDQISTGAPDNLARATDIARQLVTRFGMSADLGQAVLERKTTTYLGARVREVAEKDYSEQAGKKIDLSIRALLDEAYQRARGLLESRRMDLEAGACLLLEKETLPPD